MLESGTMSIGVALREAREVADLSIEEAAWRTRIRPEYLRALEDEEYERLGEAVFVRGHLGSYARFVGLEPRDILERYDNELADALSPLEELDRQVRVSKKPRRPRWVLAAILTGGALIGVSAVGLVHGPGQRPPSHQALPTLPPRLDQPQAASRGEAAILPPAKAPIVAGAPITLQLTVSRRCWVEVVSDGKAILSEALEPGAVKVFTAKQGVTISLGNAQGVALTFNNTPVAFGGKSLWRGTFGPDGLKP